MRFFRAAARAAALMLIAGFVSLAAVPAQALSCVVPDAVVADAPTVFTGHIVDSHGGRLLVEVEDVWKGGVSLCTSWPADEEYSPKAPAAVSQPVSDGSLDDAGEAADHDPRVREAIPRPGPLALMGAAGGGMALGGAVVAGLLIAQRRRTA
jgi:hypothetical protein